MIGDFDTWSRPQLILELERQMDLVQSILVEQTVLIEALQENRRDLRESTRFREND